MSLIEEKNLSRSDLFTAVLRDSEQPLTTRQVAAQAGFYPMTSRPWGQWESYALLTRLERHGVVQRITYQGDASTYWELTDRSSFVSLDEMPLMVVTAAAH